MTLQREPVVCPICETVDKYEILYRPIQKVDDPEKLYGAASGIPGTQQLVRCSTCDIIYENPRFPEDIILNG